MEDYYLPTSVSTGQLISDSLNSPTSLCIMSNGATWAQIDNEGNVTVFDLDQARKTEKTSSMEYALAKLVIFAYEMGQKNPTT